MTKRLILLSGFDDGVHISCDTFQIAVVKVDDLLYSLIVELLHTIAESI